MKTLGQIMLWGQPRTLSALYHNGLSVAMILVMAAPLFCIQALASQRETPVVKAVRKANAAVVNISSETEIRNRPNPFAGTGMADFFDNFFKDFFDPYGQGPQQRTSLGSGVIIDGRRGLIITNAHVLANTGSVRVTLKDQRKFEAKIMGIDPDFDLAVLQIDAATDLPELAMGTSEDLMIGETVIAIGNPFGFAHTVTTGVVSALNRSIRTEQRVYHQFIQIDASINPGNSGGPLLNLDGDLIGINTAIYAKAQGIGFAIPISIAKKIISDLITYGEVIQPWIGISVQTLDERLVRYLNVPGDRGVLINAVDADSPAKRQGLLEGDVIISVDTRNIESAEGFHAVMREYSAGDVVRLTFFRDGRMKTVSLQTEEFPVHLAETLGHRRFGIRVADVSRSTRKRYGIAADDGVVITAIREESHLARIGARPGDVIRQIDSLTISNSEDYKRAVIKYRHKTSVIVLIQRDDRRYYVTVDI